MKKSLKILSIILILILLLFFSYRYFLSGRSSFQSIYMIPPDAAWIVESNAPFDAWESIVTSKAWQKASQIEYLHTLNKQINSIDSLLSKKRFLLKALGRRKIVVSSHEVLPGRYDYLYIVDIGKITRIQNPEKILSSLLGDSFRLTKRQFGEATIYELHDRESGEYFIFSFLMDKMIMSTNYRLVEASLKEREIMTLGRDLKFIDISKRISGKGLFNVYISFKYFPAYLNNLLGKTSSGINKLHDELTYSAFTFGISPEGMLALEGYTGVNDSLSSLYTSILNAGSGGLSGLRIIPSRVASLVKISFSDAADYYQKIMSSLNETDKEEYLATLHRFEKKLKISLEENFLSWIDNEIILLQTQPSNLGRNNEFAAILVGKNTTDPQKNLDFIDRQIEKNSPVRIKEVRYGNYTITYISFPGLIKALFGKTLEKIDKPYYTIIDEFVVFSNHPQTLKNIIDDYNSGKTLEHSDDFIRFAKEFNRKNSGFSYFDVPVLFSNIRDFVSTDTWQNLLRNKLYITSFPQVGIQLDRKDDLLHLLIRIEYNEAFEEYQIPRFDTQSFMQLFTGAAEEEEKKPAWYEPVIIIPDLDASEVKEFDDEGRLKFEVELKNGIKHGTYREYYPNGKIRVKGKFKKDEKDGVWKLYDENENLIEETEFSEGKIVEP